MFMEMNFDGLVGPSHNYAGLSQGNLASAHNKGHISNPKKAALQGLAKMRHLLELGVPQALLPPQDRPYISGLRRLGFKGSDPQVIASAYKNSPALLANYASASSMWTANAATVSPSSDTQDGRVHFTPANLSAMPHRAIEGPQTYEALSRIFADRTQFEVHAPLSFTSLMGDEGAANHNRLCETHGKPGLELFIYGRDGLDKTQDLKFPARQTLQASQSVARLHGLSDVRTLFHKQSKTAINAGAFHNDVVCVANENVLFYHERAFEYPYALEVDISDRAKEIGFSPKFIMAPEKEVPLEDAISSYLFNSQIVTLSPGNMALILPSQVQETRSTRVFVDSVLEGKNPISEAHYLDLRQSMANGGGPACLRLRVVLSENQLAAIHPNIVMSDAKLDVIEDWVRTYYRDQLSGEDLSDPGFLNEMREALDALTQILDLPGLYDFQRSGT